MPTYEYECPACGKREARKVAWADRDSQWCRTCMPPGRTIEVPSLREADAVIAKFKMVRLPHYRETTIHIPSGFH